MKSIKIILTALIAAFLFGCAAYQATRQTKKDNKIFAAAISNKRVSDRLDAYFNTLHPTPEPIVIKGKDSIIKVKTPVYIDRIHDSLIQAACPFLNMDSLRQANTTIIYHNRIDTFTVPDKNALRALQILQGDYNNLQGKYVQQDEQITGLKKDKTHEVLIIIGLCLLLIILLIVLIRKL